MLSAAGAADSQSILQLDSPPPLACLLQLRVILEQLMHEIKVETKKHLMTQLQMAAAAAAGSAGVKPDASIARPLKQVKTMIKAVHRMQLVLEYVQHLGEASDLSALWLGSTSSSMLTPEQQQQQPTAIPQSAAGCNGCFPVALVAGCMHKLDRLPADMPLLALHIFWDARHMLQRCGLLDSYIEILKQQEAACMRCYITSLVPQAYEHFKV